MADNVIEKYTKVIQGFSLILKDYRSRIEVELLYVQHRIGKGINPSHCLDSTITPKATK